MHRREKVSRFSVERVETTSLADKENLPEPMSTCEQGIILVQPEYTKISKEFQDELDNHSHEMVAPFYIDSSSRTYNHHHEDVDHWKWLDSDYVKLPQSPVNTMESEDGSTGIKWGIIVNQLRKLQSTCENNEVNTDLGTLVRKTVSTYRQDAHHLSNFEILSRDELKSSLLETLPVIVEYALNLPNLLSEPIPILKVGDNRTIFLTRKLCCSILANAFFCTFAESDGNTSTPGVNFFPLFDTVIDFGEVKKEKIKCILNYFQMMSTLPDSFQQEIVSFERRCMRDHVEWEKSANALCDVVLEVHRTIEDADGMLQVDFANKRIGGGVLIDGSVMEEIRFSISPELVVSRLFTEIMTDDEAVVITGSQIYSTYSGYATSFKYEGPIDIELGERPLDKFWRTYSQIVALDAVPFMRGLENEQFKKPFIDRELHKCWVGFLERGDKLRTSVATGNWGCGAFNGDKQLKFLIQWMAASQCNRSCLLYHTWKDPQQAQEIKDITVYLKEKKLRVGQLYKTVTQFNASGKSEKSNRSLFEHIRRKYNRVSFGGFMRKLFVSGN